MNPNREERQQRALPPSQPPESSQSFTSMLHQQQLHQFHPPPGAFVGVGHIAVQAIDNESLTLPSFQLNTTWQKLSRDTANAPLLPRPTAPFARTEQKKALTSAVYYSECFLNGIEPKIADATAGEMQEQYTKWWIGSQPAPIIRSQQELQQQQPPHSDTHRRHLLSSIDNVTPAKRKRTLSEIRQSQGSSMVNEEEDGEETPTTGTSVPCVTSEDESTRGPCYERKDSDDTIRLTKQPRLTASSDSDYPRERIDMLKRELIQDLKSSGGDTNTPTFLSNMDALTTIYDSYQFDVRESHHSNDSSMLDMNGTWRTITKPTYSDCKGLNAKGEYIYALGRMAFDMFRPTHLNCSIQGVYNRISPIDSDNFNKRPFYVPRRLRHEVFASGQGVQSLRNYDVVVAFTIEANQTRRGTTSEAGSGRDEYKVERPIQGILTNHGYVIPDPDVPNRLSVWFSGGSMQVQDEHGDLELWKQLFDASAAPQRDVMEMARVLGARILLGAHVPDKMEKDGSMNYCLKRPIGGHGSAFCDVLYMDDTLRIMRGHHGSIFVSTRVNDDDDFIVQHNCSNMDIGGIAE